MMNQETHVAKALELVSAQRTELSSIVEDAGKTDDFQAASERLKRWKSRTVRLLHDAIHPSEAKNLSEKRIGSYFTGDPLRGLAAEARAYDSFLIALADDIKNHPEEVLQAVMPAVIPEVEIESPSIGEPGSVFIVHGHDELNLLRLKELLRKRWRLDSIVMSDQPGKGRTLIEKFEEEARRSAYAIVLMTPDDLIQVDEDNYTQARPNVIFELGWFYGRLGRPNVCILFKRGTRIHSDLAGISRIEFTESVAETGDELEQELLEAGVLRLSKIAQSSIRENAQKTVPALLSELKDGPSSKIRANAARELGKRGGPKVLQALKDAKVDVKNWLSRF